MKQEEIRRKLLEKLTDAQAEAVKSDKARILVVAGAGSGKTEVMARRIAWWVGVEGVAKDSIVAFTFTEKAAEEMKYRVRRWIGEITPSDKNLNLGGMYVGTIHGFCLAKIREYWPDEYHNYDILDEASRAALILRSFNGLLGLKELRDALGTSQTKTIEQFITAYDQLHEHNCFEVELPSPYPPYELGEKERDWCSQARLLTDVGNDESASAFSLSAARYYGHIRCRRFLDFSTSQTEFLKKLAQNTRKLDVLIGKYVHLVVDEVQDINSVQYDLMMNLIRNGGKLTAVGDHRQSIYGFRGAKVELIGRMWNEFNKDPDAEVVDLKHNFRSTPRIIDVSNEWARSITTVQDMETPPMRHGKKERVDGHHSHIAMVEFQERDDEAAWIAEAIRVLVPTQEDGAEHDRRDGTMRGLALSDIAVLVRSSTDVRTYMQALEIKGIPSIVRAGPDLFSQPEVLFFLSVLAVSAGIAEFIGSPHNTKSLPIRIKNVLNCRPDPESVFNASSALLRNSELPISEKTKKRLLYVANALKEKIIDGRSSESKEVKNLRSLGLRQFLTKKTPIRRIFPQRIFHWLLTEAEVEEWDGRSGRGGAAMFHLGTLSTLITSIETPGWTSANDYKWQIIGLCQYGCEGGRTPEQPLIVQPDAVTISTIHGVKGLEFAAVFLADVCSRRFPSQMAKRHVEVPLSGDILKTVDIEGLSDNENNDGERRLMYVALTRTERFLIVSRSGKQISKFYRELSDIVKKFGGVVTDDPNALLNDIRHAPLEYNREIKLATSFSDLRYYLACPHDFYLRKVLGFAPTIDQAFGYGRGVHNLMRAVHTDPEYFVELAKDRSKLEAALADMINRGLFYLRYTTGDPAVNMQKKGIRVVADYIEHFVGELRDLTFEPEKEFETIVEYGDGEGGAMISGAIDIVRHDDPPRVTLIDFKSGNPESDNRQNLDGDEMCLQVGVYAIAARNELEYEPDKGLVRYLDVERDKKETHELEVPLNAGAIEDAQRVVVETARSIRDRHFLSGPQKLGNDGLLRCSSCDFLGICGMESARKFKRKNRGNW